MPIEYGDDWMYPLPNMSRVEAVTERYFPGQTLTVRKEHYAMLVLGRCTVPTHRDSTKQAYIELPGASFRYHEITSNPRVQCQEWNCPGPQQYEIQQQKEEARRLREAEEVRRRPVWDREHRENNCRVRVTLLADDTARVLVWIQDGNRAADLIAEFTNLKFHRRKDQAAILFQLPPSLRNDARKAISAMLADYSWARSRRRSA
jgi:hypothetical protein